MQFHLVSNHFFGDIVDMHLDKVDTRAFLIERRDNLEALIRSLATELEYIEQSLSVEGASKAVVLNLQFLREVVHPILARSGARGLTSKQLHAEINKVRRGVDYANVRTFLTRAAKNGQVEFRRHGRDIGRYLLPDAEHSGSEGKMR